jgi:DMSO/TMAO reductase YedYZ heme-binding membrane subunit
MKREATKTEPLIGGWMLFGLLAGFVLALSAAILAIHPDRVEATRLVIRVTAYTSFVPFLAAFLASSVVTLAPNGFTRWLLRERRYLGLSFAFSHLVHLAAIVSYGVMNPQFWPSRSVLANTPGTIGYVFIALLAATSFRFFARRMSAMAWKRLHTAGVWVVALVYALSFLKRIPTISVLYVIPFSILSVAIIVRVVGKRAQPTSVSRHRLAASGFTAARVRR